MKMDEEKVETDYYQDFAAVGVPLSRRKHSSIIRKFTAT